MMLSILNTIAGQFFSLKKGHVLILLQNNAELRATGGFITQVFDLEVGRWSIKKRVLDVFGELASHETVEAPKAIQEMLFDSHLRSWTLRDANFDPDFRESAKQVIGFYNRVFPKNRVSGVLAVNFRFVELWLKALGPVGVKNRQMASGDLFHFLSAETSDIDRHDLESLAHRKKIMGGLASKMIRKSILRFWRWPSLWGVWRKGFLEKDLQWFRPGEEGRPWIKGDPTDLLAVVESNFLGLKSNRYIRRTIFHDTRIGGGLMANEIRILWEHFGGDDYPLSGRYQGHVRVFLPKNAEHVECLAQPEAGGIGIGKSHGLNCVEFRIELGPKGQQVAGIRFDIPLELSDQTDYRFALIKQSGVENEAIRKTVFVPSHYSLKSEQNTVIHENVLFWNEDPVRQDLELKVSIQKTDKPPRIFSHHMDGNGILVKFNEPMNLGENSVRIHEKGHPAKKLEIESAELSKNRTHLSIKVRGVPASGEIHYTVILKDIKNDHGTPLNPNPREITVVWRAPKR